MVYILDKNRLIESLKKQIKKNALRRNVKPMEELSGGLKLSWDGKDAHIEISEETNKPSVIEGLFGIQQITSDNSSVLLDEKYAFNILLLDQV